MEKPKTLSDFSLIEQEFIVKRLDELLEKHQNEPYSNFFYTSGYYYDNNKKHFKNIYFYVPEVKKFFFVSTDHLLRDLEYRYPTEPVRERIKNYSKNDVFSIDELADCKHGYYSSFDNKSIIYDEIIDLFKSDNPYSSVQEYKELIIKKRAEANNNYWRYGCNSLYHGNAEDLAYAITYLKYPQLEKMVKSGFENLVNIWIHDSSNLQLYPRNFKNGNNMNEITKLPKFAWQLLKDEGLTRDITKWNEFRVWIQKDNLSKEQLETILNLRIRDTQTIKAIRGILNSEYDGKKLYTLDSLLNYLSRVDMYQAIKSEEAIIILRDYIKMAIECKIEPVTNSNALKREHDVINRNHQLVLQAKREEYQASLGLPFRERSQELAKYEYKDDNLQVIVPKEMEDLLQEGRNNNNCVGGYIESFAKGRSNIFFIRQNEDPEKSYITIEVNNDFSGVRQAYYSSNREITNPQDRKFIDNWVEHIKELYQKTTQSLSMEKDIVDDMF